MKGVRLVAWKAEEARSHLKVLESLGQTAYFQEADPGSILKELKKDPPEAVIIDLSRSPALGRDLGVAIRVQASTRWIPLIFAGGAPEKISSIRDVLPDAFFTEWEEVGEALERAGHDPPRDPVVPSSLLAGYSGTPLPKKLGIKPSHRVLLAGGPEGFEATLGPLPEGVTLVRRYSAKVDLILWFVRSRRELEGGVEKWSRRAGKPGIWILWPKKSSGLPTDLKQTVVRRVGLDSGLVDYKIAAIDSIWSGLKFAVRKESLDTG